MSTIKPDTLVVATYAAFAPVCWDDDRRAAGRDIDFLGAFSSRLGLKAEFHFCPFDRIWERPGSGECDVAAAGIAPLAIRRAPGVVWSRPYYSVKRSLLVRAEDAERLPHMAAFGHGRIAVTRGSTADHDTMGRMPAGVEVVYYDDQQQAIEDLLAGKIDAFGEGEICSRYFADQIPDKLAVVDVHSAAVPETFAFAVREASNVVVALNAFIKSNRQLY